MPGGRGKIKETLLPLHINCSYRLVEFDRRVKKMKKKCRKGADEVKVTKKDLM